MHSISHVLYANPNEKYLIQTNSNIYFKFVHIFTCTFFIFSLIEFIIVMPLDIGSDENVISYCG